MCRVDIAVGKCNDALRTLVSVVSTDERRELQNAGFIHTSHMKVRMWRTQYRAKLPSWMHTLILVGLHLGLAALAVLREVRGYKEETANWVKVTNGVLVGLVALLAGLPLLLRQALPRGYLFSSSQFFLPAQMLIS